MSYKRTPVDTGSLSGLSSGGGSSEGMGSSQIGDIGDMLVTVGNALKNLAGLSES